MRWKIAYAHHNQLQNTCYRTIAELENAGMSILEASVPGCLEIDLMKAGVLPDLYYGTNTLLAQRLEDVHVWYFTRVTVEDPEQYLHFAGIDTFADIYINGKLVCCADNMFLPYDVHTHWLMGENEVVVHIKPATLETRAFTPPAISYALRYNYSTLYARKAAHMMGWDIMPRIVSAGLWKDVTLCRKKPDSINEVYLSTHQIVIRPDGTQVAYMRLFVHTALCGVYAQQYRVRVEGICGDSQFAEEQTLWHNTTKLYFEVPDCKLWWPKNAGPQNLYDIKVTLLHNDRVCDTYVFQAGIRTMELDRTEVTDRDGNGEFCFKVNGKKIFVLGTNWVPLDALHANDPNRLQQALELLDDIGCNMVRCWGGNVYESDAFFDYCDRQGIMVWQDFAMGCAIYPNEDGFAKKLEEEAVYQIKRLRNHPSLAVWAGDNECDQEMRHNNLDPNDNYLTRQLLKRCVRLHDCARPYLPSSPYISTPAFRGEGLMPEDHLWGPRDYFKGSYYKDTFCHFASETGYHGFPSPQSLHRFLKDPEKIFREDGVPTDEYLVHSASPELDPRAPYAYRIKLAYDQVVTLFGKAAENLSDFVRQSQISQAEAKKYFIEKFRIGKWKRTGIIWWNLLDGWPQVSDAIVDYYFNRKLAYHYIKRSQQPVCLMFDEPQDSQICLVTANDLPQDQNISFMVKKFDAQTYEDTVVAAGESVAKADSVTNLCEVTIAQDEKAFYYIEWTVEGRVYKNHYFTNILSIDYQTYIAALHKYGMDEFEGF